MKIELKGIEVNLPHQPRPLFKIDQWSINEGSRILVQGPSGKGKTTLLHLIAGLFPPAKGSVQLGELVLQNLSEKEQSQFRRNQLTMVFQKLNLLPHLTALENVLVAMPPKNISSTLQTAQKALDRLGLSGKGSTFASDLSLGEQQRVAVARVTASQPSLVLADEPTSSLDDQSTQAVCDALFDIPKSATLIVVSHDHRIRSRFSKIIEFEQLVST